MDTNTDKRDEPAQLKVIGLGLGRTGVRSIFNFLFLSVIVD